MAYRGQVGNVRNLFYSSLKTLNCVPILLIILFIFSCGKTPSSSNNAQSSSENKISSGLIKKMQANALTSTKGFKVAVKVKDGEDISDILNKSDIRYKANKLIVVQNESSSKKEGLIVVYNKV